MTRNENGILVVIPAFNEESTVSDVVREVMRAQPAAEILVINDGSTDETSSVARSTGAKVLDLPFNLGVGGAMRLGFKYAQSRGFKIVVQVDADGQHDPASIGEILQGLNNSDVVIGARFAGKGTYSVSGPRSWAMKFLSFSLSRICKTALSDTTSGFRASNVRAIEVFAKIYPAEYLGDTIESLVLGTRAGLRISQVPVVMRDRAGGDPSHSPWKAAVQLIRATAAISFSLMGPAPARARKEV